ncbi:MAG: hypothetical protein O7D30_04200, partial [Rickettsia endosymbiont of Ixodes persulcatus]|nr:hypothetical protein [Rickettsia endosymbiont of Ixodes persulcatus]
IVSFAQVTTESYDSSEAVLRTSYDQISMADSVAVATTNGRLFFYVRFSRVPTSSSKKKVKLLETERVFTFCSTSARCIKKKNIFNFFIFLRRVLFAPFF